jgi:membrane protease YdiL (CAAX protease family)
MTNPPIRSEFIPAPSLRTQETVPWGLGDIVSGLVLFALLYIVPLAILAFVRSGSSLKLEIPADIRPILASGGALLFEGSLVVPVWVMAILRRHATWPQVGFRSFQLVPGCALPITFLFLAFLASAAWGAVIQLMHWDTQVELTTVFGGSQLSIAIGFIAACIVAPIAEETFFRGFVMGGLRRRFGVIGALLLGAAFFAILHPPITIFPVIFALGLLLGLLFQTTGSLWPGILLHATFNTLGFVAQFLFKQ